MSAFHRPSSTFKASSSSAVEHVCEEVWEVLERMSYKWSNPASYTGVFIDEVQDFNDVQVFLMGLSVTSAYSQVTLSGDLCQQLHEGGAKHIARMDHGYGRRSYGRQPGSG